MTKQEARKIRSAYCNGFQYPFGGGFIEKCNMIEVNRHAELLNEVLEKQIPKKPQPSGEQNIRYAMNYVCPACGKHFSGTGIADYCYHCGQALDWNDVNE